MIISKIVKGAEAGLVATVPMTGFMLAMHQLLPRWQKYALPPEQITAKVAKRTGLKKNLGKQERLGITLGTHFLYGASAGAAYGITFSWLPLPALLKGPLYGLILWAAGYLGWVPAMDLLLSAAKQPTQRTGLMIVAHLVYGSVVGLLVEAWNPKTTQQEAVQTYTEEVKTSAARDSEMNSNTTSDQKRDSGNPGGGQGRKDEAPHTGIYPMSAGEMPPGEAVVMTEAELGQGKRGAAGYQDSGSSEISYEPGELNNQP